MNSPRQTPRSTGTLSRKLTLPLAILCCAPLFTFLALGARSPQEPDRPSLDHPIMVDSDGPGSKLFALDTWGILHELNVTPTALEEFRTFSLPSTFAASDMSYADTNNQESVVVAGIESDRGLVARYALDGQSLQTWTFRNLCSGIDVAADGKSAYVATSDSKELYRINLEGTGSDYVASLPKATKLGPLAFDEIHKQIYVADVAAGTIHQYSLATKTSRVLVTGLSAPTALSFDPDAGRLYIADPGRRAIFTIDPRAPKPVATQLVASPLKSPYGMALITKDRLAVADYAEDSIFVFSSKGSLLFRFPK
jgi:DNA-binding beta-propeller fold protein YncE